MIPDTKLFPLCKKYIINKRGFVISQKQKEDIILKPAINNNGYLYVDLYYTLQDNPDKTKHRWLLHRLVLFTFIGFDPDPLKNQGAHLDNDKSNCAFDNLAWITQSENILQDFRDKTRSMQGSHHPQAILNETKVKIIRNIFKRGDGDKNKITFNYQEFLEYNGINKRTLEVLLEGKTWKHV